MSTTELWWRDLSPQEAHVVNLIEEGCDTEEISEVTGLSANTIKTKIRNMRRLTGATSMVDLPRVVAERGRE